MNSLVFLAAFVAVAQASVIPWGGVVVSGPVGPSAILQGPSAGATVLGPDGGLIKSSVEGGVVLANKGLGLGGLGVVSAGVPILGKGPTVVVAGPAAPGGAIIAGPSGTVATGNGIGKSIISTPIVSRVIAVPQIISAPVATKVITSDLGLGLGGLGGLSLGSLGGLGLGGLGLNGGIIGDGRELW